MMKRHIGIYLFCLLIGSPAWGKVLVRWTESALPESSLGVSEIVVPWNANTTGLLRNAKQRGYRVYVEVPLQQASEAATALTREAVEGLIVDINDQAPSDEIQSLRTAHPKLKIRSLTSGGKQPQMRGQTVTTRNGVLQVSSPTEQPWLDSNLAMVRFQEASDPKETPIYTFAWELNDSLQQEIGPSADDYALAIAESGAIHADLVLDLHQKFQQGLLQNLPAARAKWKKLAPYLSFASGEETKHLRPWSNVGVVSDNYDAAYEPMNLMARHNIPFRVVIGDLTSRALQGLNVVTVFGTPSQQGSETLNTFADDGGTVVLVEAKGKYPWQSAQPVQSAEHALTYAAGKGRVIELSEPVADPETFAQDVRRLMRRDDVLISLWNALTTIAVPYRDDHAGETVIDVVNYAEVPMRIQIQVKGEFSSITYEAPDRVCCLKLSSVKRDGFTDFVIPSLTIAGRVHLKAAPSK